MSESADEHAAASLAKLRVQLDMVDAEVIALAARRRKLVGSIAATKRSAGLPLRDYSRERELILRARQIAGSLGLSSELADRLMGALVSDSLTMQEQAQVAAAGVGHGKTALVIGGAGKMGQWFREFLLSQGYHVIVADPAIRSGDTRHLRDWRECQLTMDVIVVATPIDATNGVLRELASRRPRGLIFDISSLKTPLRSGFEALTAAGCLAVSIHPMFGPETSLLRGKNLVFVDLGVSAAVRAAESMFSATLAHRAVMSLDDHDQLMGYVLGLSHAINIAFAAVLANSGPLSDRLLKFSSTTFDRQTDVAMGVTVEDTKFYYQIQRLNAFGLEPLEKLQEAVRVIYESVRNAEQARFAALMIQGRDYLQRRESNSWKID